MGLKNLIKNIFNSGQKTPNLDLTSNEKLQAYSVENLSHNLKKNIPVFVYQMGKVASSTIYSSIKKQYNGLTFHGHNFRERMTDDLLKRFFNEYQNNKFEIKLISLVREPVSRNLSAFFENFKRDVGIDYKDSEYNPTELLNIFLENYNHDIPLNWYDKNFKSVFGIDVFDYEFPKDGYILINRENVSVLLMKHDLNNELKEKIVGEFIDIPNFKLKNANVSTSKEYADSYNEVKKLKLPETYIDRMLNSKYAQHFYKNEIEQIKSKLINK